MYCIVSQRIPLHKGISQVVVGDYSGGILTIVHLIKHEQEDFSLPLPLTSNNIGGGNWVQPHCGHTLRTGTANRREV